MLNHNLFYVYILRCKNDKLYTGYCHDLDKRLSQHNSGNGAKFTNYNKPCVLVYTEPFEERVLAMRREREIKLLSRAEKLKLIDLYNKTTK